MSFTISVYAFSTKIFLFSSLLLLLLLPLLLFLCYVSWPILKKYNFHQTFLLLLRWSWPGWHNHEKKNVICFISIFSFCSFSKRSNCVVRRCVAVYAAGYFHNLMVCAVRALFIGFVNIYHMPCTAANGKYYPDKERKKTKETKWSSCDLRIEINDYNAAHSFRSREGKTKRKKSLPNLYLLTPFTCTSKHLKCVQPFDLFSVVIFSPLNRFHFVL